MRRTSIELDEAQLKKAQEALGTTGVKDTVERAFEEVIRAELRRRLAERIRSHEGLERGPEILEATRRWDR